MRYERRKDIVEKIQKTKTLKVQDLMKEYNVSIETIREDLEFLQEKGYLQRVYGGAIIREHYSTMETEYKQRELLNAREKNSIGKMASSLINDGDSVFIDYGTTTIEAVKNLVGKKNLTLITNSLPVAQELAQLSGNSSGWKIILLGGILQENELTVHGDFCTSNLKKFNVAKALMGVGGIDIKAGLTEYLIEEASLQRLVIEHADTVIALADNSKFGLITLNHICPAEELDILITDWLTPEDVLEEYRSLGITVYSVSPP